MICYEGSSETVQQKAVIAYFRNKKLFRRSVGVASIGCTRGYRKPQTIQGAIEVVEKRRRSNQKTVPDSRTDGTRAMPT